jgi:hypothetical protein
VHRTIGRDSKEYAVLPNLEWRMPRWGLRSRDGTFYLLSLPLERPLLLASHIIFEELQTRRWQRLVATICYVTVLPLRMSIF